MSFGSDFHKLVFRFCSRGWRNLVGPPAAATAPSCHGDREAGLTVSVHSLHLVHGTAASVTKHKSSIIFSRVISNNKQHLVMKLIVNELILHNILLGLK